MLVGYESGSRGTLVVLDGARCKFDGGFYIGGAGEGTFMQSGGSVTGLMDMALGTSAGSFGTCNISGDAFCQFGELYVGGSSDTAGTGRLRQEGGNASAVNVNVGPGSGLYELIGGNVDAYGQLGVAGEGACTFVQSAGHVWGGTLALGDTDNHPGVYLLEGGTAQFDSLGMYSRGTLTQSSGYASFTEATVGLLGAEGSGRDNYYVLNGGHVAFGYLTLGRTGIGYFTQANGVNATDTLVLAYPGVESNGRGTYTLTGGSLGVGTMMREGEDWDFQFTGGTLTPETISYMTLTNDGGLLHPGGGTIGQIDFSGDPNSYIQNSGGTLEITVTHVEPNNSVMDSLTMTGACQLGGTLQVVVPDAWTRTALKRHTQLGTFITGSQFTGDFSTCLARRASGGTANFDPTSYPSSGLFTTKVEPNDPSHCRLVFNGYTVGDATGDCKVGTGDLARMATNWLQSGRTWFDGDFTGDGIVGTGDLALMASHWLWSCQEPNCPERGGAKAEEEKRGYIVELKDRDGDGDFDIDDVHIILKELEEKKDANDTVDNPHSLLPGSAPWLPKRERAARSGSESPLPWPACLCLACLGLTLVRPPRR